MENNNSFSSPFIRHRNIDLRFPPVFCVAAAVLILALQALILHLFGQPLVSATHSVMLLAGDVLSAENSQHVTDWYTFSHIIHGFIFYMALSYFFPRFTVWQRFVLAVGVEAAWEVLENTPMVINHYRQQALAQGYIGDTILNSTSDTVAMIVGFVMAYRLPILVTVAIAIGLEAWTIYWIHDSLALNILGFVWTPEFIAHWQNAR